jgi:MraZ protein
MFLGEHQHTLDAKGRVSLPAKFRSRMGERVVVSKGLERCLYVFPAESYEESIQPLLEGSDFDPEHRRVRRFFTSGAVETKVDGAGRVTLPPAFREYAGLEKDVTVIGNGSRLEVWESQAWGEYSTQMDIEDSAAGLVAKGLL